MSGKGDDETGVQAVETGRVPEQAEAKLSTACRPELPPAQRLSAAQDALELLGPEGDPGLRSLAWSMVSWTHSRLGESGLAYDACQEAVELARLSAEPSRLHTAISSRAALAFENGDIASAVTDYTEALRLGEQLDNPDHVASAYNNLGAMAQVTGAFQQAVAYFEKALDTAARANSRYLEASAANNLGRMSLELGLPMEALARYEQTLELAREAGNQGLQFVGRRGLACAQLALGGTNLAVAELRSLVQEQSGWAEPRQLASAFEALSKAELAAGEPTAAVAASREAVALYKSAEAETRRLGALNGLAEALVANQEPTQALDVLEDVLRNAVDAKSVYAKALRTKSGVLAGAGEHAQAFALLQEADDLDEQLTSERAREQLAAMRASFENERREHELTRLRERQATVETRARVERWISRVALAAALALLLVGVFLHRSGARRRSAERESASARDQLARDADLKAELQRQVNLRSAELQHEVSERMALEQRLEHHRKLEAMGRLTGGIAHDFNNLMTIVLSAMELLRTEGRGALGREQLSLIEDTEKAAQSGAGITQSLLAFARQQDLQPQVVCVAEYLEGVAGLIRCSVGDGIDLSIECDQPELTVFVDINQLTTALINLAANASDSMCKQGQLTIRADKHSTRGQDTSDSQRSDFVAWVVTDTGKGMTTEELERACEPFFTTKESGVGCGLGLCTVFGFARQSGGDLIIESEAGKGTTVTLLLPECRHDRLSPSQPKVRRARFEGLRALIVEDRPELRGLLRRQLAAMGFSVEVAECAKAACRAFSSTPSPTFVLSDVVMPGEMSGIELAEWLEAHHPHVHVLLTSGYADLPPLKDRHWEFLSKPFTHDELNGAVSRVLRPEGSQLSMTRTHQSSPES